MAQHRSKPGPIAHPAGRMAECGLPTSAGTAVPPPLAECADDTLNAFRALAGYHLLPGISGTDLLRERAALAEPGDRATHNHCRLLPSADGVIGVNLPRATDWDLLPAWLEVAQALDWASLARCVATRTSCDLVERAQLLGLAVVNATTIPRPPTEWLTYRTYTGATGPRNRGPRVIDLSSLWAGPLCSRLWREAGAEVIKVESTQRPDGARFGPPAFFEQMHTGKQCIALDLHRDSGQRALRELIREADMVLEASRPRALRQMNIHAEELLAERPGLTWVSITGYGRKPPCDNWIAYGDDAGIAAGLSAVVHACTGEWRICGDAIADPLTGMHAALAGWASWLGGGGHLLDISLMRTVRHCITATAPDSKDYPGRYQRWSAHLGGHDPTPSPGKGKHDNNHGGLSSPR